ncbi:hypothetical protein N0V88_006488 [Collariella sp. IMI 366227]|nr:hypothetical protein N0V88_006488 [Collariella sp. IMI 366227]
MVRTYRILRRPWRAKRPLYWGMVPELAGIIPALVLFALHALYATSVAGQAGPDHADSRYPSSVPWYISGSCDLAKPYGAVKSCMIAKGSFAVTVYLLSIYAIQTGFAIWAMLPNKELDMYDSDDDDEEYARAIRNRKKAAGKEMGMELQPTPPHQQTPFTPRTQAFHTLDRKLPLRYG